jgi:hypothetical protein
MCFAKLRKQSSVSLRRNNTSVARLSQTRTLAILADRNLG